MYLHCLELIVHVRNITHINKRVEMFPFVNNDKGLFLLY